MKKFKNSEISFVRRYFPTTGEYMVCIELRDVDSSSIVMETFISMENFGSLVSGLSGVDCSTTWNLSRLNKIREHKKEFVQEGELDKFLVDGWEHNFGYGNHHRKRDDGSYEVSFLRYVEEQ